MMNDGQIDMFNMLNAKDIQREEIEIAALVLRSNLQYLASMNREIHERTDDNSYLFAAQDMEGAKGFVEHLGGLQDNALIPNFRDDDLDDLIVRADKFKEVIRIKVNRLAKRFDLNDLQNKALYKIFKLID